MSDIALIIPARNEEHSLPAVLSKVPGEITRVIVVDNGSTDATGETARRHGAYSVYEPVPGYGRACLAGIASISSDPPDIIAFADADGSDGVEKLPLLIREILDGRADLALSWRRPDTRDALSFQQRFGNRLAVRLIRLFWGYEYHDLGPMRALSWRALRVLGMSDRSFGWTVEMQIKAALMNLRITEIPLPYYTRSAGKSKISRTISGTLRAGIKILWVILRELWKDKTATLSARRFDDSFHESHIQAKTTQGKYQ